MQSADVWRGSRALHAALDPSERLVDSLVDPARRERTAVWLLAAYAIIWALYGIITKSGHDLHGDVAELINWSHHPAFGYSKHPPLAAWLVHAWFVVFPLRDWASYLFAMLYAAAGLWIAWHLFGYLLEPAKRVVALACLTLIPGFNFFALRFDHNAVLAPLWAATALCFIRSYDTRDRGWAALAGIAAAAAMLGKYWSIFLLAGLAVAALTDARRALYFRSAAPWITISFGAIVLTPHMIWLVQHDFIPLTYAIGAHGEKSLGLILAVASRYLAGGVAYAAVPILAVLALTRPNSTVLADMLLPRAPERRFVAVAFWATLLLPALCAPLFHFRLNPIWTMTSFFVMPVVLLSSPLLVVPRQKVAAIIAVAVGLPLAMLMTSPGIAMAIYIDGVDPAIAYGKLLAAHVQQEWQASIDRPLRIIGSDLGLANIVAFYLPQRPAAYPVLEPETAPWVTPELIARNGVAMACELPPGAHDCTIKREIDKVIAHNPPPRHVEVTLTRSLWGIAGKSPRYLIMIVPPR